MASTASSTLTGLAGKTFLRICTGASPLSSSAAWFSAAWSAMTCDTSDCPGWTRGNAAVASATETRFWWRSFCRSRRRRNRSRSLPKARSKAANLSSAWASARMTLPLPWTVNSTVSFSSE
ncbi:hypothetical protein ACFFX0_07140 [Citricoccus parietis]|uniref:Secreted protein n=1 Tax=Citricoccus parietis TaxID=592307 RepID=A0ABV5FXL8_9MICC